MEDLSLVSGLLGTLWAGKVTSGAQDSAHMSPVFLKLALGGQEWGGRPRTHLDTAAVSIPFWTGGQPLQWASEAPTILSGWTLAVHNLEGLGVVRRR